MFASNVSGGWTGLAHEGRTRAPLDFGRRVPPGAHGSDGAFPVGLTEISWLDSNDAGGDPSVWLMMSGRRAQAHTDTTTPTAVPVTGPSPSAGLHSGHIFVSSGPLPYYCRRIPASLISFLLPVDLRSLLPFSRHYLNDLSSFGLNPCQSSTNTTPLLPFLTRRTLATLHALVV